jgi:DNA-binding transcriptional LysR family regulator
MMNEIQLHRLDLNLLVTFQALMDMRSVTLAAEKLGKTPSAVSHALGRLREQLGDPLMVKVGGKMQPSPFAVQLIEDVRPILRSIQRVVSPPQPFIPAQSTRAFRLAIPTFPGLMARVFARLSVEAPDVTLEWISPSQRAYGQIAEGLIDIAMLGSGGPLRDGVVEKIMPPLNIHVFARAGHPALENWSREVWLRWPHIMIGLGTAARTTVEDRCIELGLERWVGARIPDFASVAPLLARTDLLFNNFSISLIDEIGTHDLQVLQLPVGPVQENLRFMWSSRLANDPGLQWLRRTVIECFEELVAFAQETFSRTKIIVPSGGSAGQGEANGA